MTQKLTQNITKKVVYEHAHKEYENLKKSKHDLQVECENHKKSIKFLNDKLLKNEVLKGKLLDVVKLNEDIDTLKTILNLLEELKILTNC